MCIVEVACEAKERDYSGKFVQDEEGRYVCDGRVREGRSVFVQELREAFIEALDARLRRRRRFWSFGHEASSVRLTEELGWALCRAEESSS